MHAVECIACGGAHRAQDFDNATLYRSGSPIPRYVRRLHGATSGATGQLVAEVHTAAMRISALEAQVGSRMSALEAQVGSRMSALEAQVGALGGQVSSRMTGLEERMEALAHSLSRLSDQSIVIGAAIGTGTAAK